ncbi:MAG: hypothetical protein IJ520_00520 [Synergistaceae bacterium]|nr:hypothetical protein [Synergistaceae bacterium]
MGKRIKGSQMAFRMTEAEARQFKALCVLKGTSIQAVLEQAAKDFMKKANEKSE